MKFGEVRVLFIESESDNLFSSASLKIVQASLRVPHNLKCKHQKKYYFWMLLLTTLAQYVSNFQKIKVALWQQKISRCNWNILKSKSGSEFLPTLATIWNLSRNAEPCSSVWQSKLRMASLASLTRDIDKLPRYYA